MKPHTRRINYRQPLNPRHPLNQGVAGKWLALPNWMAGNTFVDLVGLNHGVLSNMTTTASGWRSTSRPGGFGQLLFDGSNDAVIIPGDNTALDITGSAITVSAWIYPVISNNYQLIIGKVTNESVRQYAVYLSGSGVNSIYVALSGVSGVGAGGNDFSLSVPWVVNAWNLITLTYSALLSLMCIYVNAKLANTTAATGSITHTTSSVYLGYAGAASAGEAYPLNGYGDDFTICNRAWTAAEVYAYYIASQMGLPDVLQRTFLPAFAPTIRPSGPRFLEAYYNTLNAA